MGQGHGYRILSY